MSAKEQDMWGNRVISKVCFYDNNHLRKRSRFFNDLFNNNFLKGNNFFFKLINFM